MTSWRIAGDIGGTFTDLVLSDPDGRCQAVAKVLTTPQQPSEGLITGIEQLLESSGIDRDAVEHVLHGTTLITNALIERRGARTALVTTRGFRDVLHIGRELRYDLYDLDIVMPEPLVPRRWCFEVDARVLADGTVREPLLDEEIDRLVDALTAEDIESVGICLLHGYRWQDHEHSLAARLQARAPELDITTSAQVLPQIGEFDRASTTVANAYVRPILRRYLDQLSTALATLTPNADLQLVLSTGRVAPAAVASEVPIRLVESGPAGGVLAGQATAAAVGGRHALTFDMGGTTAKACYVVDHEPRLTDRFEVARVRRFARGSGLPIQVPTVELIEIGAGGGSIAAVDELRLLRVGPRSAGSDPGPACYGRGGDQPTVTDADLVLGHLAADRFLGGELVLDTDRARAALAALPTGDGTPETAAAAVRRVVDEQMAAAARMHAVEQGLDPTRFTLVATGGAGPVHACSIARILGIPRVLSPGRAGVASAHGFLGAPAGFDVARSAPTPLTELTVDAVTALLDELEEEARSRVGASSGGRRVVEAELRFRGQGGTVTVAVPDEVHHDPASALSEALEAEYRRLYGRVPVGVTPEVLTWRLSYLDTPPPNLPMRGLSGSHRSERPAWFEEADGFVPTPVVPRQDAEGDGPMIIEERETTFVVPPGARVKRHAGEVLEVLL